MSIIQKLFIVILNPIARMNSKINIKLNNCIIYIAGSVLMCTYIVWHSHPVLGITTSETNRALIGCAILSIIIIASIRTPLNVIPWKKTFPALWILCSLLIAVSSLDHPVGDGFRAMSLTMLVGFPCLYFVWGNRQDYDTLYKLIAKAVANILVIYFVICMIFFPLDAPISDELGGRYAGSTFNPNVLGMLCVAAVMCALYLVFENIRFKTVYILLTGVATMYAVFSASRSALGVIAIELLIFIIYYIKDKIVKTKNRTNNIATLLFTVVIVLLFAIIIPYAVTHQNTVEAAELVPSDQTKQMTAQVSLDHIEAGTDDSSSFFSGRTIIWKTYLENLNFRGHDSNERLYIGGGYDRKQWAHNTALEIAYRSGIIPGVLYLIIEIYTGIYALVWIFQKRKNGSWKLFSTMGIAAFCIYSMLEVVVFPFEKVPVFLYYIAIMPLFKKEKKVHE